MAPRVRQTLSLRPQGFYSYSFLAARIGEIVLLALITGFDGTFISTIHKAQQPPAASLIALLLWSAGALLWTIISWTGYSRRYLPYATTCAVDTVFFLLPFTILTIVLGLPLQDTDCSAVSPPDGKFELAVPPGKISFPADGKATCAKLFTVWGALVALCVFFAISALSVGFLELGERQLNKAVFAPSKESDEVSYANSGGFAPTAVDNGGGFAPMPMGNEGGFAATPVMMQRGGDGFGYSVAPPRQSALDDRLDLNRPVTVASRGFVSEETMGPPPPARMPRRRPEGFGGGLPGTPRGG